MCPRPNSPVRDRSRTGRPRKPRPAAAAGGDIGPDRAARPAAPPAFDRAAWIAHCQAALVQILTGERDQPRRQLTALLEERPPEPALAARAMWALGSLLELEHDTDGAFRLLKRAVQLDGREPAYWLMLGQICARRLCLIDAADAWLRCLELEPDAAVEKEASAALAHVAPAIAQRSTANPALTRAALRRQERAYHAGSTALARQDMERAAPLLERSVALDRCHYESWVNLGLARLGLGRLDESEAALLQALELRPDGTVARFNLGVVRGLRNPARPAN